jgi:hypothetical protein
MVGILQADGLQHLEGLGGHGTNDGDSGDPFPGSSDNREITPDSDPSTDNYAGRNTNIWISNIDEGGRDIVFDVGIREEPPNPYWPGPDEFGYVGLKATGGFDDISAEGTRISFSDEDDGVATIGFPDDFRFYFYTNKPGKGRRDRLLIRATRVTVSINGWLSFSNSADDPLPTNMRIPNDLAPSYLIAPLWKNLSISDPGEYLKYQLVGSSPERVFIVQWKAHREGSRLLKKRWVIFQVKLHETGRIEFCYKNVGNEHISATIGIQKDGTVGLRYSYLGERSLGRRDRIVIDRNSMPFGILVTPGAGRGGGTTFSAMYLDPDGADDLAECHFLVNTTDDPAGGVHVFYDHTDGRVGLRNDDDTGWIYGTAGSVETLSNSRATLDLAGVTATPSGNNLTVTFPLNFEGTFAGLKNLYVKANDQMGLESDWVTAWTYTIIANRTPVVLRVTPDSGKGYSAVFAAEYRDEDGALDLNTLTFHINDHIERANSVYVEYEVATGTVRLSNDAGTAWIEGRIGAAGTLSNSYVDISLGACSYRNFMFEYELVLSMDFKQVFSGSKSIFMKAEDNSGASSAWRVVGGWNVY